MRTMPAFAHGLSEMTSMTSAMQISGRYSNSLDFDQYLLASSPPGFTYNVLSKTGGFDSMANYGYQGSDNQYPTSSEWYSTSNQSQGSSIKCSKEEQQVTLLRNAQPLAVSLQTCAKTLEMPRKSVSDNDIAGNNRTERYRCGRGKKVSFADEFGFRLTEVRVFSEMPDMPSVIKTRLMSDKAKALSMMQNGMQLLAQTADVNPTLVPDFPMPISNYVALNEKVDRDFVSLESLYVSSNWTLAGTVKVKNLAFTKKVFVRCTFDAWRSYADITCNYRPTSYMEGNDHSYDWFAFTISIPADFKAGGSAAFAVCFRCNNNEYWDNNMGADYCLTSPDWLKKDTDDVKNNVAGNVDLKWATYVDWKDRSMSWPYW